MFIKRVKYVIFSAVTDPKTMRKILLSLLFVALAAPAAAAQTAAKITLRAATGGKVSVNRGKIRSVIDLTEETAGCVFVSGAAKRRLDRRGCTASPAEYKLIDAVAKSGRTYLVVLAEASGNCNVCGQCGATEAFSLIWLELDARLRVVGKKSVPIEYCLDNTTLVAPALSEEDYQENRGPQLAFAGDRLRVEYEKGEFGENSERIYIHSTLEYNRKTPEKGFDIKTEKRSETAADQ